MINDEQRIQISRGKYIENSRSLAFTSLLDRDFLKGELCMINYFKNPDIRSDIGVLVAIGIKDGKGKDCFRIISMGGTVPVTRVVNSLPDVSALVHEEIYVYQDPIDKSWYYVYKDKRNPNRVIDKISGGPFIFYETDTGYRWFYSDQSCKREDEFFSEESLNTVIQKIVNSNINVEVLCPGGSIYREGEVKNITLKINAINNQGINVNSQCEFYIDNSRIELDDLDQYTLSNQTTDREIIVEARYNIGYEFNVSYFGSTSIRFGLDFYFGKISNDWLVTEENIKSLENKKLYYKNSYLWENIELVNQRVAFCYPKKYGYLSHIFDIHGLDYIHSYDALDLGISINNVDYLVYELSESISILDLKQQYVFTDSNSIELEENNLLDLISAWKNKNNNNGLVVLDTSGKIPEELFSNDISKSFPTIKEMVTEYPKQDMTTGDVYYNTTTNKLYTAISSTTGVVSNPNPATLYVYNDTLYSVIGGKLQAFGRSNYTKINKIEEIYGRN